MLRRLLLLHSPPTPTYHVQDPGPSHNDTSFDATIVMVLAILVSALICSLCINTLIRFVIKCLSMLRGEPSYILDLVSDPNAKTKVGGVDKRALKTFKVVKYSRNNVKIQGFGSTECVICLCEFKGGEKVRILPKCNHGFHSKCIDKWLRSHSSCPTCRQSLVETCRKIIGCGSDDLQQPTSSSSSSTPIATTSSSTTSPSSSTEEMIVVSIEPLLREDLFRSYMGADQS